MLPPTGNGTIQRTGLCGNAALSAAYAGGTHAAATMANARTARPAVETVIRLVLLAGGGDLGVACSHSRHHT
jgi:hypothetical protein